MRQPASSITELQQNILRLEQYSRGRSEERKFHRSLIKNGKLFVALPTSDGYLFAPSRFVGYSNNNLSAHKRARGDGRITNLIVNGLLGPALDHQDSGYNSIDRAFGSYCSSFDISPSRHHRPRRYWQIGRAAFDAILPQEIQTQQGIWEGALKRVVVNRYERDPGARAECIAKYGTDCSVCGFSFGAAYGEHGEGFIHVHHLVPLAAIRRRYKVDPIKHLRPVCPNCHAMLHRGGDNALEIRALRSLWQKRQYKK